MQSGPQAPARFTLGSPGKTLSPRYRLDRSLGAGGMAEVFLGTLSGANGFMRQVAIKRVRRDFWAMPEYATMFVAEARLAAQLSHPNVVSFLDFDCDSEGQPFLVMEYVDGMSLAELDEAGPLSYAVTAYIVLEVLCGLGYAHDLPSGGGVVHRDVSPHNVLLSRNGFVKIADFGIAKAHGGTAASASGVLRGKTGYLSPEQLRGQDLDGRSDLFSVGIMLWELLAGGRLFSGSPGEVTARVLFHTVPPPSVQREGVPADLEQVAMRLLALNPEDRYQTAAEAALELARCADVRRAGRDDLAKLLSEHLKAKESRKELLEAREGVRTLTEPPEADARWRAPWRDPYIARLEAELARKKRWRWAFVVAILCVIAAELLRVTWG
jgi:serine/threonine protein kinase